MPGKLDILVLADGANFVIRQQDCGTFYRRGFPVFVAGMFVVTVPVAKS